MQQNDILILLIIIPLALIIWFYFSSSKKKEEDNPNLKREETKATSDLLCYPRITVVFQRELADDEELIKEVADMYVSNRAYFYHGKSPTPEQVLSEKDVYLKYENIDFSSFMPIDT